LNIIKRKKKFFFYSSNLILESQLFYLLDIAQEIKLQTEESLNKNMNNFDKWEILINNIHKSKRNQK